ncbi:hypothetical protein [Proteus mirabilis]|jgi:hypothetical protein|uniref:hypothetical protein n=1 Tax=Proteus mirabilis TaxID=584 RepID=UPI00235E5C07|nr:hypothetical protein [Proteus mirabilis]MDC9750947.1 hypothetical protein [Proteus mirabilis]
MKDFIKNRMEVGIDELPPEQLDIDKEILRLKGVHTKCMIAEFGIIIFLIIFALISYFYPLTTLPVILIGVNIAIWGGFFAGTNHKNTLSRELKLLEFVSPESFTVEYCHLTLLADRFEQIRNYLISISKLGRSPILIEYKMLKGWAEQEASRVRLADARKVYNHIDAEADKSLYTCDAESISRSLR